MKLLLVSDTHGREETLEQALEREKPDFLCHMGDVEGAEDYIRGITKCPLAMVSGNNDFYTDLNPEVLFELEGFKIFMTHGHYYYLYGGTDHLKSVGLQKGADIVLYGHTHRPSLEIDQDIILANPGSLTYPRQEKRRPSYMILWLKKGEKPAFEVKYF